MKIAILGYGGRGKNYAQILQRKYKKQAQIVAVIEKSLLFELKCIATEGFLPEDLPR